MDLTEVSQLTLDEEYQHWWIRSRFYHLSRFIRNHALSNTPSLKVLEVGCGTGQNLRYLREQFNDSILSSVTGIDTALPQKVSLPDWHSADDRLLQSLDQLDKSVKFDVMLAMDVLEHIDDDQEVLRDWTRLLHDQGHFFITVPAFNFLWSEHDVLLKHKRRYTRKSLESVAKSAGLIPVRTYYAFAPLFPLVYFIRKIKVFKGKQQEQTDLSPAPFGLNVLFKMLGYLESAVGGNPFIGTSVVGIFKKSHIR